MRFFIVLISFFSFFLINPEHLQAQNLSLSFSPPLVEIMIKPGKTISQSFKLTNIGEDSAITFQILPFNHDGLVLDNLQDTLPWLEVISPKPNFILKKGDSQEIILKISPPENSVEKDYYQALLLKTAPKPYGRYSESLLTESLASLIFMTVTTQGLPKKSEVTKFNLPGIQDSFTPIKLDINIKNTGSAYFHPRGNIILKGALGETNLPIIPRLYMANQERALLVDKKTQFFSGFFIGKYTLKVKYVLDDGNLKVEKDKIIYCIPFKLIGVVLFILILYLLISKRKKNRLKLKSPIKNII